MFGPYFTFPINPPKPPPVGSQWVKTGESLWWSVVEVETDRIVLEGPGNCTGRLYLDLNEFYRSFRRA